MKFEIDLAVRVGTVESHRGHVTFILDVAGTSSDTHSLLCRVCDGERERAALLLCMLDGLSSVGALPAGDCVSLGSVCSLDICEVWIAIDDGDIAIIHVLDDVHISDQVPASGAGGDGQDEYNFQEDLHLAGVQGV